MQLTPTQGLETVCDPDKINAKTPVTQGNLYLTHAPQHHSRFAIAKSTGFHVNTFSANHIRALSQASPRYFGLSSSRFGYPRSLKRKHSENFTARRRRRQKPAGNGRASASACRKADEGRGNESRRRTGEDQRK